jgi:hypothetical protein
MLHAYKQWSLVRFPQKLAFNLPQPPAFTTFSTFDRTIVRVVRHARMPPSPGWRPPVGSLGVCCRALRPQAMIPIIFCCRGIVPAGCPCKGPAAFSGEPGSAAPHGKPEAGSAAQQPREGLLFPIAAQQCRAPPFSTPQRRFGRLLLRWSGRAPW